MTWTDEEIKQLEAASTIQNKPFGPDKATFTEDNPVWEVVVDGRLYIRGGNGTKNGGHIRLGNQEYAVDYRAVSDPSEV